MKIYFDAEKLTARRQKAFWTQEELAAVSGVSVRTIQRMETGKSASVDSWKAVSAAFDVNPDVFRTLLESQPVKDEKRRIEKIGAIYAYAGGILGCIFGWAMLFKATPDFHGAINDHTVLTAYVTLMTAMCLIAPFVGRKTSTN